MYVYVIITVKNNFHSMFSQDQRFLEECYRILAYLLFLEEN